MISKCTLDQDGCIDLLSVLRVVNQIDQEQAWALCYGIGDLMQRLLPLGTCAPIESLAQIHLHKDGYVHEKSCLPASNVKSSQANLQLPLHKQQTTEPLATPREANSDTTTTTRPLSQPPTTTETRVSVTSPLTTTTTTTTTSAEVSPTETNNNNNNHHTGSPQLHKQQHRKLHQSPPTPPITPELLAPNSTDRKLAAPVTATATATAAPEAHHHLKRPAGFSESELVASLGIALFWALDYEIPDDQERKLNRAMECLIFQSQSDLSLAEVLEVCRKRLPVSTKMYADAHYRNVCKSLMSDTIDLSVFLEKIYTATMALSDIKQLDSCLAVESKRRANAGCDNNDDNEVDDLSILSGPLNNLRAQWRINDWARLWMQVIRELRQRGRFKQALLVN